MIYKFAPFAIFIFAATVAAEYRAYKLRIVDIDSGAERLVVSTMDHLQYPRYHFLKANEQIEYVTSWMCFGPTNQRPVCGRPQAIPQP